jgi:putative endonuclease
MENVHVMATVEILPQAVRAKPTVYVLACRDGSLYAGSTTDLRRRLAAHCASKGAKYTRGRLPVLLIAWWSPATLKDARSHEARFKRLSRRAKIATLRSGMAYGCTVYSNDLEATS